MLCYRNLCKPSIYPLPLSSTFTLLTPHLLHQLNQPLPHPLAILGQLIILAQHFDFLGNHLVLRLAFLPLLAPDPRLVDVLQLADLILGVERELGLGLFGAG